MTVVAAATTSLLTRTCSLRLHAAVASKRCSSRLADLLATMPKDTTPILAPLKKHRVKLKEKNQKFSPGTVTLQVLGSGARGAPRSLYLFTDQSRYLFNCGEGSQRLAHEHKMKLSKLEHIFITHGSWENIGGLPGVALTIQDVGVPEITLHGPEGVEEIFNAMKKFVVLRNLRVKSSQSRRGSLFEDNAIKISYVPITIERDANAEDSPRSDSSSNEDDTDYYAYRFPGDVETNGHPQLPPDSSPPAKSSWSLPLTTMCYVVRLQPRPGTLRLDKCVEAGVPPGPLLGKLKAGEDVVLDNGKVVKSADVTQPTDLGPVVLVVECPTLEFLNNFVSEIEFKPFRNSDDSPYLVAHFTPPEVMADQRYQDWMTGFGESTNHLILNESNHCMGSAAVHRIQHKLNLLDSDVFPLLGDVTGTVPEEESESTIIRGRTFRSFNLRPRQNNDNSPQVAVSPTEYITEAMNVPGFPQELDNLKVDLCQLENNPKYCSLFPRVTFLGTGSCIPNKTRNTSAILVDVSEDSSVILDCGEGTYGQLVRFFGLEKVDEVLSRIRGIYVSHLHADHHIGLVALLKNIPKLSSERPLYLLAPKQISPWLKTYERRFEKILSGVVLIPNGDLHYKDFRLNDAIEKKLLESLNLERIETTYVKHCPNAFGVSLKHSSGWKIVYSGDTMPCEDLVQLGSNCDLLIHEATMEDELEDEAKVKLHSTMSQALAVSRLMQAEFVILTHFSQRYAKLPRFSDIGDNVGIAFDNMSVPLSQLKRLVKFYPTLKLMFQDDCEELEAKAIKRQLKQEREEEARKRARNLSSCVAGRGEGLPK